jgi:hypothetical protein
VSAAIPAELLAHWLDHYGQCSRDNGKQNDCYWGTDAARRDNGCLKVGWKGRACAHWTPISENELAWLVVAHSFKVPADEPTPDQIAYCRERADERRKAWAAHAASLR